MRAPRAHATNFCSSGRGGDRGMREVRSRSLADDVPNPRPVARRVLWLSSPGNSRMWRSWAADNATEPMCSKPSGAAARLTLSPPDYPTETHVCGQNQTKQRDVRYRYTATRNPLRPSETLISADGCVAVLRDRGWEGDEPGRTRRTALRRLCPTDIETPSGFP